MMFNLLVLPLLGGFWFAYKCNLTRSSIKRVNGYRLFFLSALWGILFLLIGHVVCYVLYANSSKIVEVFHTFLPFNHFGKSIVALSIGLTIWWPINKWIYKKEKWVKREISEYGDHLDELFMRAFENEQLVQISLRNGKVYVGRTLKAFEPVSKNEYIKILPIQSGYREPLTHKITFTTNYTEAYRKHETNSAESKKVDKYAGVIIYVAEIVSASIYDQALSKAFIKLQTEQE